MTNQGEHPGSGWHPNPRIDYIADAEQRMVPVWRRELRQFAADVLRVASNPVSYAAPLAYTWLGVAAGAGISLLSIWAVKGNDTRTGVMALMIGLVLGGVFLACFCWKVDSDVNKDRGGDAEELSNRILQVDRRAPIANAPTDQEP